MVKKIISVFITMAMMTFVIAEPVSANVRFERFEMMWNDATDAERYYMPTEVKAYACGLSTADFIFFARVVEGEGKDNDDNITDKVFVAASVLNRTNCSRWPTRTVISTCQRPGQYEVVDRETHEIHCGRSLDSEWAVVIAYRMVENNEIDCHMVYYNAYGFTGYSRAFTNYAYFGGNYFSVIPCSCESCQRRMPDWEEDEVEMLPDDYAVLRPEGVGPNYL
ncbi:MAG: hypothetical protein IKN80_08195 [Clostridiales bacterium]|nr:hypothetical protein [Clostridiales bacterium]